LRDIDEPEEPETDPELEQLIAELIERKNAATKGSVERRLVVAELRVLRYTREMAGPIMEDLDPFGWHEWCAIVPNPEADPGSPTAKVLPMQRPRRYTRGSPS
jgi:hypothetical protein